VGSNVSRRLSIPELLQFDCYCHSTAFYRREYCSFVVQTVSEVASHLEDYRPTSCCNGSVNGTLNRRRVVGDTIALCPNHSTGNASAKALTLTGLELPVIEEVTLSVAVIVWLPAAVGVADSILAPDSNVESAGTWA
jgi:hypothetical protein